MGDGVRWEELFADLEGQLSAAERAETQAQTEDLARAEAARLGLLDRLTPADGQLLRLRVLGAGLLVGQLRDVAASWLLLAEEGGEALVPVDAIGWVSGLGRPAAAPGSTGPLRRRLGLGHALRGIARDRSPVLATLRDGTALTGTLDRVGADFVELAEHPLDELRRAERVSAVLAVPFAALAVLRRR